MQLNKVLDVGVEFIKSGKKRTLLFTSTFKENEQNTNNVLVTVKSEDIVASCALYNAFGQENFVLVAFNNISKKLIEEFLQKPLHARENSKTFTYKYFGQSPSQLRKKVCVLFNTRLGDYADLLKEFGNFDKIKDTAKYSARVGLLLSSHNKALELNKANIANLEDIERNGFNFTDGCGYISIGRNILVPQIKSFIP